MLDNRYSGETSCNCRLSCVSIVVLVLTALLFFVGGAILGAYISTFVTGAIVPIAIFGIILLLAVFIILFLNSCRCRRQ